jgi:hypothetical protein
MKRSEQLIQTIRERAIKPVPKGYFTLKNALVWGAFAIAVVLGALAFSVILFSIQQTDFNLTSHLSHSRLEFFLGMLPLFWLAALTLFLIFAMTSFRNAPGGYKLPAGRLVAYCTALSVLLGTLFFLTGGAQRLEHAFGTQVSLYESMQEKKIKLWSMPQDGYLSGEILAVEAETFTLRDFSQKNWEVGYADASFPPMVQIVAGEQVKIIGKMDGEKAFTARQIRPWGGMGQHNRPNFPQGKGPGSRE